MVIKTDIIGNIKTIIGKWYYNKEELLSKLANKADNTTATLVDNGLMSKEDKSKLDGISVEANKTVVDSSLSDTSENPVQNKVVKNSLENHDHDTRYYTEAEVDAKIALLQSAIDSLVGFTTTVVEELPETGVAGVMYLTPKSGGAGNDIHEEYVYVDGKFEKIGSTQTNLDLSNYVTLTQFNTSLESKADNTLATQTANGLMTKEDKAKLDGIANGATSITVDSALSATSENPVQNKVISQTLGNIDNALSNILG